VQWKKLVAQAIVRADAESKVSEVAMIRASSYNIYVDLPDNSEEMLLVQGYTGARDKVSQRVATYVRSLETSRFSKPLFGKWSPGTAHRRPGRSPSPQTIDIRKRRGYLTEMSPQEEEAFVSKIATTLHEQELRQSLSYIFMPTYDCNLRCAYCFQDHMRTGPSFGHLLRRMRRSVIDRIFTAMPKIEAHHGLPEHA
jgi:uncharacterized protein